MSASPLPPLIGSANPASTSAADPSKSAGSDLAAFKDLLEQMNNNQLGAEQAVQDLVTGKNGDVQQVVMQVVQSQMSFQLFTEVRNQVIESYNEIMRMQF